MEEVKVKVRVPTNWNDITLETYLKYKKTLDLYKDDDEDELDMIDKSIIISKRDFNYSIIDGWLYIITVDKYSYDDQENEITVPLKYGSEIFMYQVGQEVFSIHWKLPKNLI